MKFGEAIEAMREGKSVSRAGWNGKGMHIYLEDDKAFTIGAGVFKGTTRQFEPHFVMFTAQGKHQPGWLASQADMLADDWGVVGPT
jgi:hypothetical protein